MKRLFILCSLLFTLCTALCLTTQAQRRARVEIDLASIPGMFQFIDRIVRPCASGNVPLASVIVNPNNSGDVAVAPCQGKALKVNGIAVVTNGLADPGANGYVVRTAANVTTVRTFTASTPLSITNGSGVAGATNYACATCTTNAAALTSNQLVLGAGSQAATVLGSLGTTVTVLHGNAAGAPSFAVVTPGDAVGNTSGSGNFALVTSPVFTTPNIGVATATELLMPNGGALERGFLRWSGNVFQVGSEANGGANRDVSFIRAGTVYLTLPGTTVRVNSGGLDFTTDNAMDIGASGANRPRSLFIGTNTTSTTYSTTTNCADSAGAAACGSASSGSFVIDAATTSTVVSTTSVTANSQIHIQEDSSLNTRLSVTCNTQSSLVLGSPRVTARTAGTSFTVTIELGPTTNPMCLNYTIIN